MASSPKTDGTTDWAFDIVGTYTLQQPDWATRIFANYDFINEAITTGKNQASIFYVGINDPAKSAAISQTIDDRFANSPDQTSTANEKDYLETTLRQIGDINYLVNGVVGAVLFTLLFLTSNTIAQSVRERTAELAVLKTLGFTDASRAVAGAGRGTGPGHGIGGAGRGPGLARAALGDLRSGAGLAGHRRDARAGSGLWRGGAGRALLLALISGVPPAVRARRLNIVTALSGR